MALELKNPEQIREYVKDKESASSQARQAYAARSATDAAYSEGVQYLNYADLGFVNTTAGRSYLPTTVNPDSNRLRVIYNILTKRLYKVAGATWPSKRMEATVEPPVREGGVEASVYSQVMEDLHQSWMRKAGYVGVRQQVNYRRVVNGVHGLLLRIMTGKRTVTVNGNAVEMPDSWLECDDFHMLRLLLDPAIGHRDLRKHEEVPFHDVWTINKARAVFPDVKIDPARLSTVGQLAPYELNMATLSGGRIFGQYRQYSNTKGVRVYQIHAKDRSGRWGVMYTALDIGEKDWVCPNLENPYSPFGGDGLPLVLYHGHQRADSPYSVSDAAMGKDAQDLMNIAMTQHTRAMRVHSGYNWVVDRRFFDSRVSDEDLRGYFHNRTGGIIPGKPHDPKALPPQLVTSPAPSPHMLEMVDRMKDDMLDSMFRSEVDLGIVKTHVTKDNTTKAMAASGQILGIRVEEDLQADAQIGVVALGTLISLAQKQSPSVLAMMDEEGFDEEDFGVVLSAKPEYPTCSMVFSSGSIRYRSPDEIRDTMLQLASMPVPAIEPDELTKGLADIDMPASEDDRQMRQQIEKEVALLIRGQEWTPLALGPKYGKWLLITLEKALFDKRVRRDPAARQRVAQALAVQQQVMVQQQIANDPALVVQQQQAQMEMQAKQMEAQQEEQAETPQTIGEMMDLMAENKQ